MKNKENAQKSYPQVRLQKILSQAGIASRREAERMIVNGRIRVNGALVMELGTKADPSKDAVTIDGKPISQSERKVYLAFHKPLNVMVTRHDPQKRPTIYDFLKEIPERVNPVGRLDFDSEGLLLLTNDGELLARLTHPRHEVPKIYHVKISGHLRTEDLKRLATGVDIGGYVTRPCRVKVFKQNPHNQWIEMELTEGKNRQVRQMIEVVGSKVLRLVRAAIGPIRLGDLKKGSWRKLNVREVELLQERGRDTRP